MARLPRREPVGFGMRRRPRRPSSAPGRGTEAGMVEPCVFLGRGKIREHSDGAIAPQLGRLHKKATNNAGMPGFSAYFRELGHRSRPPAAARPSLATGFAMRETMP